MISIIVCSFYEIFTISCDTLQNVIKYYAKLFHNKDAKCDIKYVKCYNSHAKWDNTYAK